MERVLVLLRHGQSEYNVRNVFTGRRDPGLTPLGVVEAHEAGRRLATLGIRFEAAFASELARAKETARIVMGELGQSSLAVACDEALDERDYGELSGLDKDETRKRWGETQVQIWRRSYDVAPPGGESLRDTLARALPFYMRRILPCVMRGERCLVSAHGNTLRALVMALDGMTASDVQELEIPTGALVIYHLAPDTSVETKQTLVVPTTAGPTTDLQARSSP